MGGTAKSTFVPLLHVCLPAVDSPSFSVPIYLTFNALRRLAAIDYPPVGKSSKQHLLWQYRRGVSAYNRISFSLGRNTDCSVSAETLVSIIVAIHLHGDEGENEMKLRLLKLTVKLQQIAKDTRGQDLIEYALMAGFVAVAAGAIMPGVASSINVVFSKVNSIMITAAAS